MKLLVYQVLSAIYFKDFDKVVLKEIGHSYKLSSYKETPKELLLRFIDKIYINENQLLIWLTHENIEEVIKMPGQ